MSALYEERSLGQLFGDLAAETRRLIQQELNLAKTEMTEKAAIAGRNAAFVAAGGVVVLIGVLTLVAWIVIAAGQHIGYALAAFIVGAVITAAGAFLVMKGIATLKAMPKAPVETQAQLKETTQWLREQKTT